MRKTSAVALTAALVVAPQLVGTAHAAQPTAAKKPSVTLAVSNRAPSVGDRITVSGVVVGAKAGTPVTIAEKVGGRWTTFGTAKIDKRGAYRVSVKVTNTGAFQLRSSAKVGKTTVASGAANLTGYAWFSLFDADELGHTGADTYRQMKVGSRTVKGWSTALGGPFEDAAVSAFDLGGQCTDLSTTAVMSELATASVAAAVVADGSKPLATRILEPGDQQDIDVSVRGVKTLMIGAGVDDGVAGVLFAEPLVRCSWQ